MKISRLDLPFDIGDLHPKNLRKRPKRGARIASGYLRTAGPSRKNRSLKRRGAPPHRPARLALAMQKTHSGEFRARVPKPLAKPEDDAPSAAHLQSIERSRQHARHRIDTHATGFEDPQRQSDNRTLRVEPIIGTH